MTSKRFRYSCSTREGHFILIVMSINIKYTYLGLVTSSSKKTPTISTHCFQHIPIHRSTSFYYTRGACGVCSHVTIHVPTSYRLKYVLTILLR